MIDIYLGEKLSTVPMVLGWGGSDARPNLEPKLGSWARFLCSVPGNIRIRTMVPPGFTNKQSLLNFED